MSEFLLVIAVPFIWGLWELFSLARDGKRKREEENATHDSRTSVHP